MVDAMISDAQPTAAPSKVAAEHFGDYVLQDRIAQGGMAEVLLAKRRGAEGFEKIVAIKRILPELSASRDFVSMFINEAKIAARLSHPNIVQIFDFGRLDDYYFIAMEYVHGVNLRELLTRSAERKVPLTSTIAASIAAHACAGLDHAHGMTDDGGRPLQIIHRDVSPQNVLVSYEGEVKVVDFGIAKAIAENPGVTGGVVKGKLSYLSPEQLTGATLDPRCDVFAMGAVLYELLAGKKLFDRPTPEAIIHAILNIDSNAVAHSVRKLDRGLRAILRRALHADPEERFSSAGEMQWALETYLRKHQASGSTLELANFMQLLFGERTVRSAAPTASRRRKLEQSGQWQRLAAATAGAALAAAVLYVAAPALRKSPTNVRTVEPRRIVSEPRPSLPQAPAAVQPVRAEVSVEAPPAAKRADGLADLELANAALARNQPAEAVAAFEKAFAISPPLRAQNSAAFARALAEEGRRTLQGGDLPQAVERLKAAVAADPDSFDAHFLLAKAYTRRSAPEDALREYQEAVRINPKSSDAHFNRGFVYFSQKRYDPASREYESVVELKPTYLEDAFYNLSLCFDGMKRPAEEIATLRRGLQALPNSGLLQRRLQQLTASAK